MWTQVYFDVYDCLYELDKNLICLVASSLLSAALVPPLSCIALPISSEGGIVPVSVADTVLLLSCRLQRCLKQTALQAITASESSHQTVSGRKSEGPSLASYMLCGRQNARSKHLQALYMLWGGQNALSKLIQASYTLCGGQNALSTAIQASYRNFVSVCLRGFTERRYTHVNWCTKVRL